MRAKELKMAKLKMTSVCAASAQLVHAFRFKNVIGFVLNCHFESCPGFHKIQGALNSGRPFLPIQGALNFIKFRATLNITICQLSWRVKRNLKKCVFCPGSRSCRGVLDARGI